MLHVHHCAEWNFERTFFLLLLEYLTQTDMHKTRLQTRHNIINLSISDTSGTVET